LVSRIVVATVVPVAQPLLYSCRAKIWPVGMIYSTYQAFADVHDRDGLPAATHRRELREAGEEVEEPDE
jgi:hypothetical protein